MRYLLAIGGLLLGAALIFALWLFIPRTDAPPASATVVGAASAQAAGALIEADTGGEGSFRVCNQTRNQISVAFGYRAERGWRSEGWWVVESNGCETIFTGDLGARSYYYLYAADDIGGGAWEGNVFMCTKDENFTISDVDDCLARGYERTGFFEIDTRKSSNWTVQLTESQVLGAEPVDDADLDAPLEGELEEGSPTLPAGEDQPAEGAADP